MTSLFGFLEFYPIIAVFSVWAHKFKNKKMLPCFFVNNKCTSYDSKIMALVRKL